MSKTVLVAGYERHIARLVEVNLQRDGYIVFAAFSDEEALATAKTQQPDLVLVSPFMAGLPPKLKADSQTMHLVVITLPFRS